MLRYCYVLCLLIYIILSFCFEYSSCSKLNRRNVKNIHRYKSKNPQSRRQLKRDNGVYDKDPVFEINLASFINSAEDESINGLEHDSQEIYEKTYNDGGSLINDLSDISEDYDNSNAKNIKETPQDLKVDTAIEAKKLEYKFPQGLDLLLHNGLHEDGALIKRNIRHQQEKKCILKNIKIPFFSHNNTVSANDEKDGKKKLNKLRSIPKENEILKDSNEKFSKIANSENKRMDNRYFKIKKRSYIEQLCPECKRKFIAVKYQNPQSKRNYGFKNFYGIRHNKNNVNILKNTDKPVAKYNSIESNKGPNNKQFVNYWTDKRRKREKDDRNMERQKELDYLEKRIESVNVKNSPGIKGRS